MIQEDLVFFNCFESYSLLKKKLSQLGPEPFDKKFNFKYISIYFKRKKNIKNFY